MISYRQLLIIFKPKEKMALITQREYDTVIAKLQKTGRSWKVDQENPNIITSSSLEVIHIHAGFVKYWEDLRMREYQTFVFEEFEIS